MNLQIIFVTLAIAFANADDGYKPRYNIGSRFCKNPPQLSHGHVTSSGLLYTVGSYATYKCDQHYVLKGSYKVKCTSQGWEDNMPMCKWDACYGHECDEYSKCEQVNEESYKCVCNEGYHMMEEKCKKIMCKTPMKPAYGKYIKMRAPMNMVKSIHKPMKDMYYYYMDKVMYNCDEGYKLYGPSEQKCDHNGMWMPMEDVKCKKMEHKCMDPPLIKHGHAISNMEYYPMGHYVSYKCDMHYIFAGSNKMKCGKMGWEGETPRCKWDACFGHDCDQYSTCQQLDEESYKCVCKEGYYKMNGKCHKIKCAVPMKPDYGKFMPVKENYYYYDDKISYQCDGVGYKMYGPSEKKCHHSGKFMPMEEVKCKDIDECMMKTYQCDKHATCKNTKGSYTCECKPGYYGDGKTCNEIMCESPMKPYYGKFMVVKDKYYYGDKVTYKCDYGYKLYGPSEKKCDFSGKFMPMKDVECKDIDECTMKTYECDKHATCKNTNGSYTCVCKPGYYGDGKTCKKIQGCYLPSAPLHGYYVKPVKSIYGYGDRLQVKCHDGYYHETPYYMQCNYDNTWTKGGKCTKGSCKGRCGSKLSIFSRNCSCQRNCYGKKCCPDYKEQCYGYY